ncbi:hypothetical protein ACFQGT_09655 [Natrialbaceae archaeon GCM10025810]|uniref:hypothetical protein n=1 Tax=Halovalidus salilacus TaxID=3075124 RepID=UPI0036221A10
MDKLKFSVSVEKNRVPKRIKSSIKDGMRDAGYEILETGEDVAQDRIRAKGRIWKRELINSFEPQNHKAPKGRWLVLRNISEHAAPVEEGATYTKRGPPIAALIPWILEKWTFSSGLLGGTEFSERRALRVSERQQRYEEIAEEIQKRFSFADLEGNAPNLKEMQNLLFHTARHDDLDGNAVDEIRHAAISWKGSSTPNDRVAKYSHLSKRAFGLDGTPRADYDGDIRESEIDAMRVFHELSNEYAREHLNVDEDGNIRLHRGLTHHTAELGAQIFNYAGDDEWQISTNALENFSTKEEIAHEFSRGLVISQDKNVDSDVTLFVDGLFHTGQQHEFEVHVRGGDSYTVGRDEVFLPMMDRAGPYLDELGPILDEIESSGFDALTDKQLHAFARIVSMMDRMDVQVTTPAGQSRLLDWQNAFIGRGLHHETGFTEESWINRVNRIIG